MPLKCKNCGRGLYTMETKEDHILVCGGIEDDSAEAIGDIDDHFSHCCFRCGQEVDSQDDLHINWAGNELCHDCTMER